MEQKPIVGIDVCKDRLDVAVRPTKRPWHIPHDDQGHGPLVKHLQQWQPALMVIEATGGLERAVTAAIAAAGLPIVVVNPRPVRDVAKAMGQRATTDQRDAEVITHVGAAVTPEPRPLPDEQTRA